MVMPTGVVVDEVADLRLVTRVVGEEAAEEEVEATEMPQLMKNVIKSKHQRVAPILCPAKSTTTNV